MNLLDQYAILNKNQLEAFEKCIRSHGEFRIGPTKRGSFFLQYKSKDIISDPSITDLIKIRDLINDFLENVVGEK